MRFINPSMGLCKILEYQNNRYLISVLDDCDFKYIVCNTIQPNGSWCGGIGFNNLEEAIREFDVYKEII